ncbi:MAG TPA: DUF2380 domain-containing protein [Xanthobacteraceae bacterium]|nr:DUF2380 domain-containing protein [Xanthobacteraceae bacterium]
MDSPTLTPLLDKLRPYFEPGDGPPTPLANPLKPYMGGPGTWLFDTFKPQSTYGPGPVFDQPASLPARTDQNAPSSEPSIPPASTDELFSNSFSSENAKPNHPQSDTRSLDDNSPSAQQFSDASIMSDASPEDWFAGERYAQARRGNNNSRRGSALERPLTIPEENNLLIFNGQLRTLQQLDPTHRYLRSLSSPDWIPTSEDIHRFEREIERIRVERELWNLERHHLLPRRFESNFARCNLNIENYTNYLWRPDHRLLPNGLHTGPNNWNAQWRVFFDKYPNAREPQIMEQLNRMLKQHPLWEIPWHHNFGF